MESVKLYKCVKCGERTSRADYCECGNTDRKKIKKTGDFFVYYALKSLPIFGRMLEKYWILKIVRVLCCTLILLAIVYGITRIVVTSIEEPIPDGEAYIVFHIWERELLRVNIRRIPYSIRPESPRTPWREQWEWPRRNTFPGEIHFLGEMHFYNINDKKGRFECVKCSML